MGLGYRLHNWAAENFRFVQFPRQVLVPAQPAPPFFKNAMWWPKRVLLAFAGLILVTFAAVILFFAAVFLWAIFSVVLGH